MLPTERPNHQLLRTLWAKDLCCDIEYIENYFKRYTGVKKYMEEMVVKAKKDGYVSTLFG